MAGSFGFVENPPPQAVATIRTGVNDRYAGNKPTMIHWKIWAAKNITGLEATERQGRLGVNRGAETDLSPRALIQQTQIGIPCFDLRRYLNAPADLTPLRPRLVDASFALKCSKRRCGPMAFMYFRYQRLGKCRFPQRRIRNTTRSWLKE